jgi:hypothetical protein
MTSVNFEKFDPSSLQDDASILIVAKRRSGKSLLKGSLVLKSDGKLEKVENIKIGDYVMGDDSEPRLVLETHNGMDEMYKVTNKRGENYTVNSHHILSLVYTTKKNIYDIKPKYCYTVRWFNKTTIKLQSKQFNYRNKNKEEVYQEGKKFLDTIIEDRYIDIPILDFMNLSKKYKENLIGYAVPISFPEKEIPLDPYMVGYWLGDGTAANSYITSRDSTILNYFRQNVQQYNCFLELKNASKYGYQITSRHGQTGNLFLKHLRSLNLLNNKHVPDIYKHNSRENRLKLLAGFIDADGHLGKRNDFEITQCKEHELLLDDMIYICRSLGFTSTKHFKKTCWTHKGKGKGKGLMKFGDAFRFNINGKGIEEIPTLCPRKRANPIKERVNSLVSSITIESVGRGEYYGIGIDGNNRYVLGNFIVTHNSFLIRDIFYHKKEIPYGMVFSGTEKASPFFSKFIPDEFIYDEYKSEKITNLFAIQEKKVKISRDKGLGKDGDGKVKGNNAFIVLDDMLQDASTWNKDNTIKSIFYNGRHYNIFFILAIQYINGITPGLRGNLDYVFIFNEPSVKTKKKLWEEYVSMVPDFKEFCNILDQCTKDFGCLVVKLSGEQKIYWYKADTHSNFKVSEDHLWKHHKKNYNKNYNKAIEEKNNKLIELKEKYKNSKNLKVFVDKDNGKIINIENKTNKK